MAFFEKIWALDESAKTKILVGTAAVAMIIVISLWYVYFNSVVIGASGQAAAAQPTVTAQPSVPPAQQTTPTATQSPAGPGLWQDVTGFFAGIAGSVKNMIQTPGQYNIQPQH